MPAIWPKNGRLRLKSDQLARKAHPAMLDTGVEEYIAVAGKAKLLIKGNDGNLRAELHELYVWLFLNICHDKTH